MKRFNVGDQFSFSGIYGERYFCTVVERTETAIRVVERWAGEGTDICGAYTELPVTTDGDCEIAETWEYLGHHGYVYATA